MKNKFNLILLVVFSLVACKKEGCTNEKAENYRDEAKKDDGSCTFNGKAIFWFNSDTALNLAGELLTTLDVYVENTKIGSIEIDKYTESAPSCDATNGVSYSLDLGTSNTKNISFTVKSKDLLGEELVVFSGNKSITGGDCNPIEIKY